MRLLTAISATDLARLPQSSRTVLATSPTAAQRSLPPAAINAISQFTREYATWLAAQPPKQNQEPAEGKLFLDFGNTLQPMNGGLGKVLLILTRNSFSTGLQAELLVSDQAGNIVTRQFRMLTLSDQPAGSPNTAPGAANAPAQATEKPIELSAASREHAAFMNQAPTRGGVSIMASPAGPAGRQGGVAIRQAVEVSVTAGQAAGAGRSGPRLQVNAEWQGKLAHPEANDPLSFAVSDLYMGLARQKGVNLVADLPDSILIPLSSRALQAVSATALMEASKNNLNVEEAGGWLTISPKSPVEARENRVNREELSKLMVSIQKEGRLSLDALCRYALSRNNPAPNPALDSRYISTVFPAMFGEFNQAFGNWRIHQLYATLSADQRRNLGNGGVLNLGLLAPNQRNIVSSLVFDDQMGPILQQPNPGGGPQNVSRQQFMIAGEGGNTLRFGDMGGKLMDERTELLPTGLPHAGTVSVDVQTSDAVYATRRDGSADPRFMNAETLGVYMGMSANIVVAGNGPAPNVPQYDTFKMAQVQTLNFVFKLSPQADMMRQLRDSWFVNGAGEVGYEGLPADFRTRVEEASKRMGDKGGIRIGFDGAKGQKPPL